MRRQISCPRCAIRVDSIAATHTHKKKTLVRALSSCHRALLLGCPIRSFSSSQVPVAGRAYFLQSVSSFLSSQAAVHSQYICHLWKGYTEIAQCACGALCFMKNARHSTKTPSIYAGMRAALWSDDPCSCSGGYLMASACADDTYRGGVSHLGFRGERTVHCYPCRVRTHPFFRGLPRINLLYICLSVIGNLAEDARY